MQSGGTPAAAEREPSTHADPVDFGFDLDEVRPLFAEYVQSARRGPPIDNEKGALDGH